MKRTITLALAVIAVLLCACCAASADGTGNRLDDAWVHYNFGGINDPAIYDCVVDYVSFAIVETNNVSLGDGETISLTNLIQTDGQTAIAELYLSNDGWISCRNITDTGTRSYQIEAQIVQGGETVETKTFDFLLTILDPSTAPEIPILTLENDYLHATAGAVLSVTDAVEMSGSSNWALDQIRYYDAIEGAWLPYEVNTDDTLVWDDDTITSLALNTAGLYQINCIRSLKNYQTSTTLPVYIGRVPTAIEVVKESTSTAGIVYAVSYPSDDDIAPIVWSCDNADVVIEPTRMSQACLLKVPDDFTGTATLTATLVENNTVTSSIDYEPPGRLDSAEFFYSIGQGELYLVSNTLGTRTYAGVMTDSVSLEEGETCSLTNLRQVSVGDAIADLRIADWNRTYLEYRTLLGIGTYDYKVDLQIVKDGSPVVTRTFDFTMTISQLPSDLPTVTLKLPYLRAAAGVLLPITDVVEMTGGELYGDDFRYYDRSANTWYWHEWAIDGTLARDGATIKSLTLNKPGLYQIIYTRGLKNYNASAELPIYIGDVPTAIELTKESSSLTEATYAAAFVPSAAIAPITWTCDSDDVTITPIRETMACRVVYKDGFTGTATLTATLAENSEVKATATVEVPQPEIVLPFKDGEHFSYKGIDDIGEVMLENYTPAVDAHAVWTLTPVETAGGLLSLGGDSIYHRWLRLAGNDAGGVVRYTLSYQDDKQITTPITADIHIIVVPEYDIKSLIVWPEMETNYCYTGDTLSIPLTTMPTLKSPLPEDAPPIEVMEQGMEIALSGGIADTVESETGKTLELYGIGACGITSYITLNDLRYERNYKIVVADEDGVAWDPEKAVLRIWEWLYKNGVLMGDGSNPYDGTKSRTIGKFRSRAALLDGQAQRITLSPVGDSGEILDVFFGFDMRGEKIRSLEKINTDRVDLCIQDPLKPGTANYTLRCEILDYSDSADPNNDVLAAHDYPFSITVYDRPADFGLTMDDKSTTAVEKTTFLKVTRKNVAGKYEVNLAWHVGTGLDALLAKSSLGSGGWFNVEKTYPENGNGLPTRILFSEPGLYEMYCHGNIAGEDVNATMTFVVGNVSDMAITSNYTRDNPLLLTKDVPYNLATDPNFYSNYTATKFKAVGGLVGECMSAEIDANDCFQVTGTLTMGAGEVECLNFMDASRNIIHQLHYRVQAGAVPDMALTTTPFISVPYGKDAYENTLFATIQDYNAEAMAGYTYKLSVSPCYPFSSGRTYTAGKITGAEIRAKLKPCTNLMNARKERSAEITIYDADGKVRAYKEVPMAVTPKDKSDLIVSLEVKRSRAGTYEPLTKANNKFGVNDVAYLRLTTKYDNRFNPVLSLVTTGANGSVQLATRGEWYGRPRRQTVGETVYYQQEFTQAAHNTKLATNSETGDQYVATPTEVGGTTEIGVAVVDPYADGDCYGSHGSLLEELTRTLFFTDEGEAADAVASITVKDASPVTMKVGESVRETELFAFKNANGDVVKDPVDIYYRLATTGETSDYAATPGELYGRGGKPEAVTVDGKTGLVTANRASKINLRTKADLPWVLKVFSLKDPEGITAAKEIVVKGVEERSITFDPFTNTNVISMGGETTLHVDVNPATEEPITWTSDDEGIATVDQSGVVRGVAEGRVKIFASVGQAVASTVIRVKPAGDTRYEGVWGYVVVDGHAEITEYTWTDSSDIQMTALLVPAQLGGYPVTRISARVFAGSRLPIIALPGTVTTIGAGAFANSAQLHCLYIPASVTTFEDANAADAFKGCGYLNIYGAEGSRAEALADEIDALFEIVTGDLVIMGDKRLNFDDSKELKLYAFHTSQGFWHPQWTVLSGNATIRKAGRLIVGGLGDVTVQAELFGATATKTITVVGDIRLDLNGDGMDTIKDAKRMEKALVGKLWPTQNLDVNEDRKVDNKDVVAYLQYLATLEP